MSICARHSPRPTVVARIPFRAPLQHVTRSLLEPIPDAAAIGVDGDGTVAARAEDRKDDMRGDYDAEALQIGTVVVSVPRVVPLG